MRWGAWDDIREIRWSPCYTHVYRWDEKEHEMTYERFGGLHAIHMYTDEMRRSMRWHTRDSVVSMLYTCIQMRWEGAWDDMYTRDSVVSMLYTCIQMRWEGAWDDIREIRWFPCYTHVYRWDEKEHEMTYERFGGLHAIHMYTDEMRRSMRWYTRDSVVSMLYTCIQMRWEGAWDDIREIRWSPCYTHVYRWDEKEHEMTYKRFGGFHAIHMYTDPSNVSQEEIIGHQACLICILYTGQDDWFWAKFEPTRTWHNYTIGQLFMWIATNNDQT